MSRRGPFVCAVVLFLTIGADRAGLHADLPERSARVVTYTIAAELVPEHQRVKAEMDLVWRNTSDEPVDHLYFHLYMNAFRDEDSSYLREGGGGGKRGDQWEEEHPGSVTVSSMRLADGRNLWIDGTRMFEAPDDGNEDDRTLARVNLPAPVAPGETLALKIAFSTQLPRVLHRTGWAGDPDKPDSLFFMVAQWFPKLAVLRRMPDGKSKWNAHQFHRTTEFFSDYGVYQVSLKVPRNYIVGATGPRISGPTDNGDGTVTVVHRQEDVHDFAWTASPHFHVHDYHFSFDGFVRDAPGDMGARIQALLERTARHLGLPVEQVKPQKEVDVRILLQPDHAALADRFQWSAAASIACYGIWFGAYPYDVLTIVDPPSGGPSAGGMEYPTLITIYADRTAPEYVTGMEGVTIHEFGHQFFYGLIGSNEFEEAWLDEGFTSYTDSRVFEEAYGPRKTNTRYTPLHTPYFRPFGAPGMYAKLHSLLRLESWLGKLPHPWQDPDSFMPVPGGNGVWEVLRDLPPLHLDSGLKVVQPSGERGWVFEVASDDAMVMPGWHFASRRDYGVNSYGKPTVFLYALRGLMGEDAFDKAMRQYAERFRFAHPTTANFLEAVREQTPETGRELVDGFVNAMIETATRLDVAVLSVSDRKLTDRDDDPRREWTIRVQRRGDIPVPIEVHAISEDGESERLAIWHSRDRETTRTFRVVRDKPLGGARLGPDWLRFVDADISNNARVVDDRADSRAAALLALRWSLYAEEIVRSHVGLAR